MRWRQTGLPSLPPSYVIQPPVSPACCCPPAPCSRPGRRDEAVRLAGDGIVLLPRGNDGVGIVGAFGDRGAPALPILLVRPPTSSPIGLPPYRRVALAMLAQDRDSTAAIAAMPPLLAAELAPRRDRVQPRGL